MRFAYAIAYSRQNLHMKNIIIKVINEIEFRQYGG